MTLFEAKLTTADDAFQRGHYSGWIAATNQDLEHLRGLRDDDLIPEQEEPYDSLRERLLAEEGVK